MLTDAGPLVAVLDKDDANHVACVAAAERLPAGPLETTWPCFTEAMYLLGEVGGFRYQRALWEMRSAGRLILMDLTAAETDRMAWWMDKYKDAPMDLADASLMAVAESRAVRQLFTCDRHFHFYRLADGSVLDIVA